MLVAECEEEKIEQLCGIASHLLGDDSRACPGSFANPMSIELLICRQLYK